MQSTRGGGGAATPQLRGGFVLLGSRLLRGEANVKPCMGRPCCTRALDCDTPGPARHTAASRPSAPTLQKVCGAGHCAPGHCVSVIAGSVMAVAAGGRRGLQPVRVLREAPSASILLFGPELLTRSHTTP
jgi:hypothetical protein